MTKPLTNNIDESRRTRIVSDEPVHNGPVSEQPVSDEPNGIATEPPSSGPLAPDDPLHPLAEREMVRLATAGSVDDGKSTLLGRLLYDSKATFDDQWESIEAASKQRGDEYVDLALLTDGLRAEREQGITIDVAYRYFATPRRKFILADTPGHVQYTRNMVTGASTANIALILVDARNGVLEQTRRHAYISALLGIPRFVLCVNKMDLVDFDQSVFEAVRDDFTAFAAKLGIDDLFAVPVSALHGDNVVDKSDRTPWYDGPALLDYLETVEVGLDQNLTDARFPVQYVIRPMSHEHHDYRGYAGTVASGVFHPGDAVVVLPSGIETTVEAIDVYEGTIDEAFAPMSVTLRLADDVDVSRGDLISAKDNRPSETREFEAMVCWMTKDYTLTPRAKLAIKHTTRSARAVVEEISYRLNVNTLEPETDADSLVLNEIGRIRLRTNVPLFVDPYARNQATGSFILIDEVSNNTVAAGMIVEPGGD